MDTIKICLNLRRVLIVNFLLIFIVGFGLNEANASELLTVWTNYSDIGESILKEFERYSGKETSMMVLGEAELEARLKARQPNPPADIIFGFDGFGLNSLAEEGLISIFPRDKAALFGDFFIDKVQYWVPIVGWKSFFLVNNEQLLRYSLKKPTTWEDLADSSYRGRVAVRVAVFGKKKKFKAFALRKKKYGTIMQKIMQNEPYLTENNYEVLDRVIQGKTAIGVSVKPIFLEPAIKGSPNYSVIVPKGQTYLSLDGIALVNKTEVKAVARIFINWIFEWFKRESDWANKLLKSELSISTFDLIEHSFCPGCDWVCDQCTEDEDGKIVCKYCILN